MSAIVHFFLTDMVIKKTVECLPGNECRGLGQTCEGVSETSENAADDVLRSFLEQLMTDS